jgi:hypothetical protein
MSNPIYQNLSQNIVDPSMDALLNLVSKQRQEIRRLEGLMVPNPAAEFVQTHNTHKNKQGQLVDNKVKRYKVEDVQDYDRDDLNDTIVTKDGKLYSFNGFITKDTDY